MVDTKLSFAELKEADSNTKALMKTFNFHPDFKNFFGPVFLWTKEGKGKKKRTYNIGIRVSIAGRLEVDILSYGKGDFFMEFDPKNRVQVSDECAVKAKKFLKERYEGEREEGDIIFEPQNVVWLLMSALIEFFQK